MLTSWFCSKYGWRGHWFKGDREICECGLSKAEKEMQPLIRAVLKKRNFAPLILPLLFFILSIFFIVSVLPSFLEQVLNPDGCTDISTNYTSACVEEPSFPLWAIDLPIIGFVTFFIMKFFNGGMYE